MVIQRERIAFYLSEARKFADAALVEFDRWEKEKTDVVIRDAAEKAWNAVVQATNALLLAKGFEEDKIKSHRDRRLALDILQFKDLEVKERGLRDRFSAREHNLHMRCFYEGEYIPEGVEEDIQKSKLYVEEIAKMLEG